MQLSVAGEECICCTSYHMMLNVQKATDDVDARTSTLRDKVSSAHVFFLNWKQVSGLSIPLQPSPVASSPARKKSKSSNGENRGIARDLFHPQSQVGTHAEPLLLDPLDMSSVVHHAPVISPENTVSTAPSRIPRHSMLDWASADYEYHHY